MAVEGLDTGEDLAVVAAGDQDLGAGTDCGLENGEGTGGELMLLDLGDFILSQLGSGLGEQFLDLGVDHVDNCDKE